VKQLLHLLVPAIGAALFAWLLTPCRCGWHGGWAPSTCPGQGAFSRTQCRAWRPCRRVVNCQHSGCRSLRRRGGRRWASSEVPQGSGRADSDPGSLNLDDISHVRALPKFLAHAVGAAIASVLESYFHRRCTSSEKRSPWDGRLFRCRSLADRVTNAFNLVDGSMGCLGLGLISA